MDNPSIHPHLSRHGKRLAAAGFLLVLIIGASLWVFVSLGRWFQFSENPQPSDIVVILCGDPSRAIKAAELYRRGFASEIWVGRAIREAYFVRLDEIGIRLPLEEELMKSVLVQRGVPKSQIRFYGKNNLSTFEEAQALRSALGRGDVRILLVTTITHTRRSKMIFESVFPEARILAVASNKDTPQSQWWTRKLLAEAIVKEVMCTVYFKLGGQSLNHHQ